MIFKNNSLYFSRGLYSISIMASNMELSDFFPENRQSCQYRSRCYRSNHDHLRMKKHDHSKTFLHLASSGSTEVLNLHPKVKVLSPSTPAGTGREEMTKIVTYLKTCMTIVQCNVMNEIQIFFLQFILMI
jgi:hypothetical protein